MTIKELKYFPIQLNFKTPFQTSAHIFTQRDIIIIRIRDELNNIGFGEISPLPQFGSESLKESFNEISGIIEKTINLHFEENINSINQVIDTLSHYQTVRFGISYALLQILLKRGTSIDTLFGREPKNSIPVNGVIGMLPVYDTIKETEKLYDSGFRTIKLKIGRDNFIDDYRCIEEFFKNFDEKIKLRLDVNGKWNRYEAKENLAKLAGFPIEYIEQPVEDNQELLDMASKVNLHLAPDESIKTPDDIRFFLNSEKIDYMVLKPALLGNIFSIYKTIKKAEAVKKNIIITSVFESDIGKSALLLLAALVNHDSAHGLAVREMFKDSPIPTFIEQENGKVNFESKNILAISEKIPDLK